MRLVYSSKGCDIRSMKHKIHGVKEKNKKRERKEGEEREKQEETEL